jgi:hypothetical protein
MDDTLQGRLPIAPKNPWARGANWIVASCAAVLLVTSLGVYLYHRRQLGAIAEEHLRVVVAAPSVLSAGAPAQVHVRTASVTGEPAPAQLELALFAPDGRRLWGHKERTGPQGRLDAALSCAEEVPRGARLEVLALRHDKFERLELPLGVEPAPQVVHLRTDKPFYRPGETIRYRLVTLSPFALRAPRETTVAFEVRKPDGAVMAGSVLSGVTDRGVGNGEFALPAGAAAGTYTLSAHSADDLFPPREWPFAVRRSGPPEARSAAPEAPSAAPQSGESSDDDRNDEADEGLDVRFHPEGGRLAPGLENRVYFTVRNRRGEPVDIKGFVVDAAGNEVVMAETAHQGMGSFRIVPSAGARYRLRVRLPQGGDHYAALPPAARETHVALTTGTGVFAPGEPLEFNVRRSAAGPPLVVAAWRRGALVGQQALVSSDMGQTNHPVVIPLADEADGVIRLTVFDYGSETPRPLAERLVYRRSSRRVSVEFAPGVDRYEPGDMAEVSLRVRDSAGRPVAAVLGVVVIDEAVFDEAAAGPPGGPRPSLAADLLLAGPLSSPDDLENADFYLSDDPKAALALDLLLGTRGGRQPGEAPPPGDEGPSGTPDGGHWLVQAGSAAPPAVADNLGEIRQRYEESLAAYRAKQTQTLSTVTTLTFFGGLGLLLLVAMLGLLKIVSGSSFWLPAAGATACCLAIGAILLDPERQPADADPSLAFCRFDAVLLAEREAAAAREQARQTGRFGAEAAAPTPFAIREYAYQPDEHAPDKSPPFRDILYWHPLLATDAEGRAKLVFHLPNHPAAFRILVDAHGDGQIGGGAWRLVTQSPEAATPEPEPADSPAEPPGVP